MRESHRPDARARTAARVAVSQLSARDIALKESAGWHTQPATVIFWPGPPLHVIYMGMGQSLALHRHYATQISISLGAPLRMRIHASKPFTEQQSFVVGSDIPHQVETLGVPSIGFWSEARTLATFARRLRAASASELPALPSDLLSALVPAIRTFWGQVLDEAAGQALLSHILTTLLGPGLPDQSPDDPRIASALSQVTPEFLVEQPQPISSLAAHVHLSPSRFRHLFRSEMGMSVQSYLRWQRLFIALRTSVDGASLTEAAHTAGFADSAHLTRVFRATFGLPPSHIFKNSHFIQVMLSTAC